MVSNTATTKSPWFIIPADDKSTARRLVSSILAEELAKLNPQYPQVSPEEQQKLQKLLKELEKGKI